jgi:hypothetical protein
MTEAKVLLKRPDGSIHAVGPVNFKVLPRVGDYVSLEPNEDLLYRVSAIAHAPKASGIDVWLVPFGSAADFIAAV